MRKRLFLYALTIPFICICIADGCGPIKEVPVKEIEKVVVRDSIIYRTDTISIEIPKEVIKEVIPDFDTSYLETSLSFSMAYLDKEKQNIHHTLINKEGKINKEVENVEKVVIQEKIINKEIPIDVPVPYIPQWCWLLIIFNVGYFGIKLGKYLFKI